ncbi:Conserved_hypothetical protein [Hexamita inflata]|uniref:Uncharacterized protein n=1 Tax=Hexamita inflata TaxID=28002 RepID=A0AA86U7L3_9EUKA|nr:Conserved hypothetical protein [Hexamita inflata]
MLFVQILGALPTILTDFIQVKDCYSLETEAVLFPSNKTICFNLISYDNPACELFPKGVKVTAQLDQFDSLATPYKPYGFVYDFDYKSTKQVCIQCLDTKCTDLNFQLSTKVKMRIESTSRYTECVCGKVGRVEENRTSCFHQDRINALAFESKVVLKPNQVCYWAAVNDECPQMTGLTQVNASISIQYNDTAQTYVYKPANASTSFALEPQAGTSGYFKYCFTDANALATISKRIPLRASIGINVQQRGVALKMVSGTQRVQIEDSADGFSHTTAFIQVVEIQLYGTISDAEKNKYAAIIAGITNPKYFAYIQIQSKGSDLNVVAYQSIQFSFETNIVQYMARTKNPNLPNQIQQILNTEEMHDLVIFQNLFVTDANGNVVVSYRKMIDNVKVTCWSSILATWNSQTQLTIDITITKDLEHCEYLTTRPAQAMIGFINDSVTDKVYPSFVLDIPDYSINTKQIILTTTDTTVVSEPTLILTNVYVIIALENQITVFMLIITYSINSAVHFFFTSSFK